MNKTMSRVVQQEQRTLRRKKRSGNPCSKMCLLSLMLAPLAIIISIIYFLQVYNEMVQQQNKMRLLKGASEAARTEGFGSGAGEVRLSRDVSVQRWTESGGAAARGGGGCEALAR